MPTVSDHAVLRYVERVMKIDVEAIRQSLAAAPIEVAADFGCSTIIRHDCELRLRGDVVTTVVNRRRK